MGIRCIRFAPSIGYPLYWKGKVVGEKIGLFFAAAAGIIVAALFASEIYLLVLTWEFPCYSMNVFHCG